MAKLPSIAEMAEQVKQVVLEEILIEGKPLGKLIEDKEIAYVIRCKDCKFHHDRTQCKKRIGAWFDDDYCNGAVRAERMDGDRDEPAKRL